MKDSFKRVKEETTASTMQDALRLYNEGSLQHLDAVYALEQTSGRGRIPGRVWKANYGESLLTTLVVDLTEVSLPPTQFPLISGVAVWALLKKWGIQTKIKWPNDVLVQDKKICGILCEYQIAKNNHPLVLCGIGLNINQHSFNENKDYRRTPTSVFMEKGESYSIEKFLQELQFQFAKMIEKTHQDDQYLFNTINENLYNIGKAVTFVVGHPNQANETVSGILIGIDFKGQVQIQSDDGEIRSFISGEF